MDKIGYQTAALKYRPIIIKTLFIAESPPAFRPERGPSYFYFVNNPGGDVLFAAIVKALFDLEYKKNPNKKRKLLKNLRDEKCSFLLDVCKQPINRDNNFIKRSEKERKLFILKGIHRLNEELQDLKKKGILHPQVKIILIKKNIYSLLFVPLKEAGFNVLNKGKIDFPKYHGDRDTVREIRKVLNIRSQLNTA